PLAHTPVRTMPFTLPNSPVGGQSKLRNGHLRHPAARHPPRCRLLGVEADRVDPHGARRPSGHPVESPAATEPRWPAADLDRRGVGQAHQYRALLRMGLGFLPLAALATMRLASNGDAVALTHTAVWVIALAAWQARRPALVRSPRLVLPTSGRG